jgi:hypothetical protein
MLVSLLHLAGAQLASSGCYNIEQEHAKDDLCFVLLLHKVETGGERGKYFFYLRFL